MAYTTGVCALGVLSVGGATSKGLRLSCGKSLATAISIGSYSYNIHSVR